MLIRKWLVVVYAAAATLQGAQRLSTDVAESMLSFNFARTIAVAPGGIHVVWFDTRIHYRRSLDDGRSWEGDTILSAANEVSQQAAVAASGSTVYVAWHEIHGSNPRIVLRRSFDSGATWLAPQRLTDPAIHSAHPSIAATDANVHLTWFDGRHGLSEIYTRHSEDGGESWEPEQRISNSDAYSWVSTIEASDRDVYIGWVDYIDGNEEEYLRRSVDGGRTWQPELRLTDDDADSWAPSIALAGAQVHFAWFDRRDAHISEADLEAKLNEALILVGLPASATPPRDPRNYYLQSFLQRLQDKGRAVSEAAPRWVAAGGEPARLETILREFERLMREWTLGWEIYYKTSSDRGATFGPDRRLTFATGASQRPSLTAVKDQVALVWFDNRHRDDAADIFMKFSSDGGRSWSSDMRLTDGAADASLASSARSEQALHVVWVDRRHGAGEIYYQRIPVPWRRRLVDR